MKTARFINKKTAALAGALSLLAAGTIYAQINTPGTRTLTIVPPTIDQKVNPSDIKEGKLKIINDSSEEITFNVVVRDFIVKDNKGTPNILPPGTLSNKYSAASWIGVAPDSFTVAPHKQQEFQYFLKVPQNARPGGHYAAVVYEPTNPIGLAGTGAAVNTQLGTLFYINVAGAINENAQVTQFSTKSFQEYGPVAIATEIKNLGDLHIRPIGTIVVKNMLGQRVDTQNLDEHNIFPEASFLYGNKFGQKFMFGRYTATLYATYGTGNSRPLMATVAFIVFPWKMATVALLIAIAIVLALFVFEKRKKKHHAAPPTASE